MATDMSKIDQPPAERASKRRKLSPPPKSSINIGDSKLSTKRQTEKKISKSTTANSQTNSTKPTELPTVKGLDSSEPSIRRKALQTILAFLSERETSTPLTSTQCLQLWRGFFVVTYMHDSKNAVSVQNLLKDLAGTFTTTAAQNDPETFRAYHIAFHETLIREWAGIDSHRMNKYLLLARFVLKNLFLICIGRSTEGEGVDQGEASNEVSGQAANISKQILEVLQTTGPLNPSDRKIPDGLRLHFLDIWNDEFFAAIDTAQLSTKETSKDLQDIVASIKQLLENISKSDSGAQRHIRLKAKETIIEFDERLNGAEE